MGGPSLFICPLWTEGWNGQFRQMAVDGDSIGCPLLSIHFLETEGWDGWPAIDRTQ